MHQHLSMGDQVPRAKTVIEATEETGCCPSVIGAPLAVGEASELATGFHALGDPVRLRLLSMLAAAPEGELCVCELIEPLAKSQGTISHHLRVLGEAGLVHGDRRGKWVWYSLDYQRLASLKRAIDVQVSADDA
jgi:ArsR family transcriptional regulator, arsenate/arsenite/antimonite-responsive transcriptional repressor